MNDRPLHHSAILTPTKVLQIRFSQKPQKVLAIENHVSESTISRIRNGSRWKWLDMQLTRFP